MATSAIIAIRKIPSSSLSTMLHLRRPGMDVASSCVR
jgi:hypothetical protein